MTSSIIDTFSPEFSISVDEAEVAAYGETQPMAAGEFDAADRAALAVKLEEAAERIPALKILAAARG